MIEFVCVYYYSAKCYLLENCFFMFFFNFHHQHIKTKKKNTKKASI